MFTIWFPPNFFYPSVIKKWEPVVQRLKLPYETIEDFFNSAIQSVTLPGINLEVLTQQQSQFKIGYKDGKELEPIYEKNLDITFKLSEGFITYWIIFDQIQEFLKYKENDVFWPSLYLSFLNMQGFELVSYEFKKLVPTKLSNVEISYSTTAAEFNTFVLGIRYNRFNIKK